jgi:PAS domain S-box-containing protein
MIDAGDRLAKTDARATLDALLRYAPVGISIEDVEGTYLEVNAELCAMLHYPAAELLRRSRLEIMSPEGLARYLPQLAALLADQIGRVDLTLEQRTAVGEVIWTRLCATSIARAVDSPVIMCMAVDVTAQVRAMALLQERQSALDSSRDGIALLDPSGNITHLNLAQIEMTGKSGDRSNFIGQSWTSLFDLRDVASTGAAVTAALTRQGHWRGTLETTRKRHIDALFTRTDTRLTVLSSRDVTDVRRVAFERRALRRRIEETERGEALARLSSGLAHDVGNLIGAIGLDAGLLKQVLSPGTPAAAAAWRIGQAAERGTALVKRLRVTPTDGHVAPDMVSLDRLSVSPVVDGVRVLVTPAMPPGLRLVLSLPRDSGEGDVFVLAERLRLEQALVNLVHNSIAAIERAWADARAQEAGSPSKRTTDSISIRVRAGWMNGKMLADLDMVVSTGDGLYRLAQGVGTLFGPVCEIQVADTGPGMGEATLKRAFQPLFTTKGDSGTGLGLASVLGLVRSLGGLMITETAPGRGCTMRMLLPQPSAPVGN